ncbi:MAG: hypothetical protein NWF01_07640 [Candidatus Bathyarchaeota archaeon]|nr:hypothetical protein [Candidatus Bathyarchaeota archaeon]
MAQQCHQQPRKAHTILTENITLIAGEIVAAVITVTTGTAHHFKLPRKRLKVNHQHVSYFR